MGCCGRFRQRIGSVGPARPSNGAHPARRFSVTFEYTGSTGMTVVGPVSGRRYRFDGPGARVVIDLRDRPGLARVPTLREVG